jgi:hypothetical protein
MGIHFAKNTTGGRIFRQLTNVHSVDADANTSDEEIT